MSSLNVYFAGQEQCVSGHSFGPAIRQHYLLHMILNGKGTYQTDSGFYQLEKGQAFLIYPGETTYYQADSAQPWEYAWVAFDGFEAEEILDQTCFGQKSYISPKVLKDEDVGRILELVRAFQERAGRLELTGCLYRVLSLFSTRNREEKSDFIEEYYRKAVEYIHQNYGYPLRIAELAGYVGIDRTYLYRVFMEKAGCPPKQFLLRFRIREAMQMLDGGGHTVTETAYSCGFRDTAAFCSCFRREVGMTPAQYRKGTIAQIPKESLIKE